jgi:hypothetical protein
MTSECTKITPPIGYINRKYNSKNAFLSVCFSSVIVIIFFGLFVISLVTKYLMQKNNHDNIYNTSLVGGHENNVPFWIIIGICAGSSGLVIGFGSILLIIYVYLHPEMFNYCDDDNYHNKNKVNFDLI